MNFSLKSLLILATIIAICLGWWFDRTELLNQREQLRIEVQQLDAQATRDRALHRQTRMQLERRTRQMRKLEREVDGESDRGDLILE